MPPPPLLSPAELLDLRHTVAPIALANDICDITDPGVVAAPPSGGTAVSGATTTAAVPCLVYSSTTPLARFLFGEQQVVAADHLVATEYGTVVRPGWRITLAGAGYSVVDTAEPGTFGMYVYA